MEIPQTTFLGRPAFRSGVKFKPLIQPIKPSLPQRRRVLDKDGRLRRPSFKLAGPKPRALGTIASIEAMRVKQEGIKVRLGEKLLGKVRVKRRDNQGNIILDEEGNPIFEEVPFNFGLLQEIFRGTLQENIDKSTALANLLRSGASKDPLGDRTELSVRLTAALDRDNILDLSTADLDAIGRDVQELKISNDPVIELGEIPLVDDRFVTNDQFQRDNIGPILLFLLANSIDNPNLTFSRPLLSDIGVPLALRQIDNRMARGGVMDLIGRRLYPSLDDARRELDIPNPQAEVIGQKAEVKQPDGDPVPLPIGQRVIVQDPEAIIREEGPALTPEQMVDAGFTTDQIEAEFDRQERLGIGGF